jgi:alkylation response protein AidB-like acyl-CoA dehydrogenase
MTTVSIEPDVVAAARELAPAVRESADETERLRHLAPGILQQLRDAQLFDLVLPRKFGGLEVDILTMMRVVEELSAADGATGWCVGIGVGTSIVSASLDEDVAREIFAPGNIWGGPVAPMGRATPVEGGHRVTGRWQFASGCNHCSWLVGGSLIFEGDAPKMLANGMPAWRLMTFPREDVEIIDTWNVSGLRGTGSHDIAVKDAFVPENRSMGILADGPVQPGPLYRYPIFGFLALSVAPVATGIARRAIDEVLELAQKKTPTGSRGSLRERGTVQADIALAEAELRSGRGFMYEVAEEIWETCVADEKVSNEQRAMLRLASAHAVATAVRAVDIAYRLGGGTSLYETSVLQRCFRDVHAATQHIVLGYANYELAGQVMLGMPVSTMAL